MELEQVQFELKAILGTSHIPLGAYYELQTGDLLVLDENIETRLELVVGEKKLYKATAGLHETHKAVRIDERIHP
ncbi:MAG: hypothetical protein S4CHLAM123_08580 [Chlamydiales bacterium]|nr:hypothetical protein [Chlamydiales bacterium]